MAELFTLGYEGSTLPQFLRVLRSRQIDVLLDVREAPVSRKPGFSKLPLSLAAEKAGVSYEHWPEFGCPRPIRDAYRADGNWNSYTKKFLKHLPSISDSVELLVARALREKICLVCFEADPASCHRSLISQSAAELCDGVEVVHLNSKGLAVAVL